MKGTMKDWALMYAGLGFAVFPLWPRDKRPATENGFKAATTDRQRISDWWDKYPDCNIGIATGAMSGGLVVIDLDIDEDKGINGYEMLKQWQQEHGVLPDTWQSITGRGGYHLFYRDAASNKSRTGLYEGVDIRADGGYIVAPPSIHPNGNRYEWEQGPGDGIEIAQADIKTTEFLLGDLPDGWAKKGFQEPETIPEGGRVKAMIQLIGSLKGKGLGSDAIRAAVQSENEKRCVPPLTNQELEKEVFPALARDWKAERPYTAVPDQGGGGARPIKKHSLDMLSMGSAKEEEPEWLVPGHIPKYQVSAFVGDGGAGKTSTWCAVVAAISSGKRCFLLGDPSGINLMENEPQKVLFFSAEDSYKYTIRRKLRKNGANLDNILTIDVADERFQDIKFDSPFLEQLIAKYRPALVVFDPVQAFVPPNIRMGERNAMRACLAPLIGYGEKYGCTFLIIVHTNKMSGVWGRKRMADSSDMWDLSRCVEMIGETGEPGIRYISQEKSNYGLLKPTVLFSIEDEVIKYRGMSDKKDRDFVTDANYNTRQAPAKEAAKEFILDFLKDGEKEVAELDEMASVESITKHALKDAKSELRKEGKIKSWGIGYGKEKKWFMRLVDDSSTASEKPDE